MPHELYSKLLAVVGIIGTSAWGGRTGYCILTVVVCTCKPIFRGRPAVLRSTGRGGARNNRRYTRRTSARRNAESSGASCLPNATGTERWIPSARWRCRRCRGWTVLDLGFGLPIVLAPPPAAAPPTVCSIIGASKVVTLAWCAAAAAAANGSRSAVFLHESLTAQVLAACREVDVRIKRV